jgi:RIO kinase 1
VVFLSKFTPHDLEDEPTNIISIKRKHSKQPRPTRKTSYEANADVQRWLKEQAVEEETPKPPFNPTFLASLRDGPWILSSLTQFYEDDLITDVLHVIKSGKEATVYCCVAHPSTGFEYLAAKVYRPRMFRSLKNDTVYRQSRLQRDQDGQIQRGSRGRHGGNSTRNERGRAAQVASWIDYEFETQSLLYSAGASVPKPIAQVGNAVLMEYVGALREPAPLLREIALPSDDVPQLFADVIQNIELFLLHDRIHGDLSEYNMLYWQEQIVLIDFAQAVDPRHNLSVYDLLERDIARVCHYFARYGIKSDAYDIASTMWQRYLISDL